ncbi:hypothetical protein XELAEV_18038029mg [Xenopus laevis]|uniref:Secreted protein n=1 Tax=Xenopus laevis TaxID=8355 RepID=A0A974HAZ4_XENLA|nr:hypothetical protein XELAEV_18038029mg [Xenopus laevis]
MRHMVCLRDSLPCFLLVLFVAVYWSVGASIQPNSAGVMHVLSVRRARDRGRNGQMKERLCENGMID